jgi:hypothetical protein
MVAARLSGAEDKGEAAWHAIEVQFVDFADVRG